MSVSDANGNPEPKCDADTEPKPNGQPECVADRVADSNREPDTVLANSEPNLRSRRLDRGC